ncbi:TIGR02234 family membrane protein [Gordonia sp. (in: high G+C Gram-positive bacteria)]|uniref:TIGR02234 family membrane protein n=1 Tax=Gordonia sp. (in: high G+C Gram-positive bacteria) TaxID=84139 RepID=UPI003C78C3C1
MSDSQPATATELAAAEEAAAKSKNRRLQLIASLLILLAALGLWAASRMTWATILVKPDLGPGVDIPVRGSDWSPWLVPVALAMVAAVIAQFAVRGWALRIVAILVALGGVLALFPAISLLTEGQDNLFITKMVDMPARAAFFGIPIESTPGYLVIASAICAIVGAIAMARTARKDAMSSKYSSPAARREELERQVFAARDRAAAADQAAPSERIMWDSLDEGLDPTDDGIDDEPGSAK